MSPIVSAVLAGTIFGLFHLNPFDIVALAGLGIFLGLLRYRSQSLLLPILAHFLNNAMAVFAAYVGMDNDNLAAAVAAAEFSRSDFSACHFRRAFCFSFYGIFAFDPACSSAAAVEVIHNRNPEKYLYGSI